MPIPKMFGVTKEAAALAAATLDKNVRIPEGDYPVARSTQDNGVQHARWAEVGVIERAYVETDRDNNTQFVLGIKVRDAYPNKHKFAWVRAIKNYEDETDWRNEQTDRILTSLLTVTGMGNPEKEGIPLELLQMLFPVAKTLGSNSPLRGKEVTVNFHYRTAKDNAEKWYPGVDSFSTPPSSDE